MPALGCVTLPQRIGVPRRFVKSPMRTPPVGKLAFDPWPCLISNMKACFCSLFVLVVATANLRADLTVVQTLDGPGGSAKQITIYIKGDKMRMDTAPQVSTIVDGK